MKQLSGLWVVGGKDGSLVLSRTMRPYPLNERKHVSFEGYQRTCFTIKRGRVEEFRSPFTSQHQYAREVPPGHVEEVLAIEARLAAWQEEGVRLRAEFQAALSAAATASKPALVPDHIADAGVRSV